MIDNNNINADIIIFETALSNSIIDAFNNLSIKD